MLKILHIIQKLSRGGAARSMIATAKYSARMGVVQQHRIIHLSPAESEAVLLAMNEGMYVINQPNKETIWREIEAADIVHIHFWNNPEIYELLHSEIPAMRLVVWFKIIGDQLPHIITKELLEYTDFAIVTSPYTLELPVFKNLSSAKKNSNTDVVYGIADFDRLKDFKPQPHDTFNVGYIGTVDFAKMHSNYVKMSAKVKIQNVRFIVCGDGINSYLQQEAEKLGVAERFEFRGYVEDIKSVLEILDVFGYPLCEDTYATSEKSLQEAMLAGVPPVVFPFGGVKRLVIHHQTGLVVNNETEYKNAIEYLYYYPEERLRLGRNAQEYARQNFSPENATKKINQIYARLLQEPKRKRQWRMNEISGAELFIESLGEAALHFSVSMNSENISELLAAENRIANSSPVLCNKYGGGIFHYRDYYLKDGYLRLWSGLILQKQGQHHQAISELTAAINLGCNHWRVGYYLATSAYEINHLDLAEKVLRQVRQKAPSFTPGKEMFNKILGMKAKSQLSWDNFQDFTYSKRRHFNIFRRFGYYINLHPDAADLKFYQDILVYNFMTQNLPPGAKLLEIGGGNSRIIEALKSDYECWNIDKLEGKGNGPTNIKNPNGYRLVLDYIGNFNQELPNNYFDCVFSISTLEHLPEDEQVFKDVCDDINRVLKPNGISLHCLDIVIKKTFVWSKGILPYIFQNIQTLNQMIPFKEMQQDPDLYVMSEFAYQRDWQSITKESYAEFGKPVSYNILWQKQDKLVSPTVIVKQPLPKISIVTPSLNQGEFLTECIDSVLSQKYPNLEYIIMDGGSKDNSVEIIKKYEKHLTYWQSQPDGGHYSGINLGFSKTTGEIMAWLNSDDKYHPDAFFKVVAAFQKNQEIEWIMGRPTQWDKSGKLEYISQQLPPWSREGLLNKDWQKYHQWIQQESTFWQRSLWKKSGSRLSTEFQFAGDFELWMRFSRYTQLFVIDNLIGGFRYYENQRSQKFKNQYVGEVETIVYRELQLIGEGKFTNSQPAPKPVKITATEIDAIKQQVQMNNNLVIATSIAPGNQENQQGAILSWQKLGFTVVSLNNQQEINQLEAIYKNVTFYPVKRDAKVEVGRPLVYIDDLLAYLKKSGTKICGIVNSDIRLLGGEDFLSFISQQAENAVIFGSRVDIDSPELTEGEVYQKGFDIFFFDKELLAHFPESKFCLGLPWWDLWIPAMAIQKGLNLKYLTTSVADHVKHEVNYSNNFWQKMGIHFAEFFNIDLSNKFQQILVANPRDLQVELIQFAQETVSNIHQKTNKIQYKTQPMEIYSEHSHPPLSPINEPQLTLQRQFWNVNSLDEAMFGRVLAYKGIDTLSPEERKQAWQKSIQTWIPEIMKDIPAKPEWKVLEIGCGVGRLIKYLREIFAQVDGVDISENMIQFAKQYLADGKQNGEVYINNGCDLQQLADQSYDFVYSTIVFQHIRSISIVKSYFSEIFRVLKPEGYFRLQVHDHSAPDLGNFDEEGSTDKQYYFSGNAYTEEQLKNLLLEAGFNLVSLTSAKPWIWATVKREAKSTTLPKVSAIVSTYNSEKFIRGCLEDLVNQTLYKKGGLEIMIIDSASQEKEGAIAQEFQSKYPNIVYQRTPERETIYAAWNRAIKIAKGKYITNANTDDRHRPDALEKMANYLDNNPNTSLVYGDQIITTLPNDSWAKTQGNKRWNWPKFDYSELERRCIIGPQPMWRKSVHEKYGYFRSEFNVAGDYEFWLRIGKTEKIEGLPEILGLYFENQQGLEKADERAKAETDNICREYGIFQRGVQRKTSVTTQISASELMTLPYRDSDLVSVIILCYNQAQYLTEAVESVVNQTYENWECLIVNDGSSDQTVQVAMDLVEKYSEKSLRLIEKENTGVPDSRNVGINHSSGKFILFVDADDKIHPNFIEETLAVLKTNPQVGFVYTDIQKFGFEDKLESYGDFNVKRFLMENQAPVTSLFRREIYQQVGGFKTVMEEGWEDWEFWVSAYQKGWLGYRLEKPYLYYRQHSDSSRQQKLHQNPVNLAVHKAIIIYLHSQLYSQQEVIWSEQILYKYRNSLMTELNLLKSQPAIKYPEILPIDGGDKRPFWSVMIPTYNPTSTLEKTLKSVLQQATNIDEMQIEVVDDCSTQVDVEEVVKNIGQGRISYYRQPQNLGLIANWNDCIKRASGQWVHILHQDDFVLPGFYSRLGNLLENEPQVGASFCRHYYIDENDNQKMLSPLEKETPGIISHWLEKIAVMQRIQCASIVVKRSVYEQVGGFCPEANSAADWEMWKRIAANYPVAYEPESLACYRWHSTSESSRLIKFGGNIADTRKAIQISESYLPPEIATKLSNQAREHYAISATQIARQMLGVGETKSAIAQIQEALKCSQSSQVKEAIISLFLTSDSTPQININQLLSEINNYVEQYQKDFSNQSVLNHLRQLRQQIANYWLNLPTEKLESAYLSDIGKAHQKLISSSLKYEQITDTEKSFVNPIKTHIERGLNQQNSIQYLLAATLYYYPHQLSPNWFEQAPIPKWFVNDYMKFMIDAPSYFQEIGEADNYYRYTLNWSNYLHQRICSNSDSKIWQDIAWFFTQKTNFIPLYFNSENLKEIYIKRAEIMEIALQSRGFKLDYIFPERPVNRNKIRLGILSSHFTPQTETFSTLPFFEHLDKTKFEIILYTKNLTEYPLEKYCQSRAERLVKLPDNLMSQVETIRTDDLDILLIGTNITAITNPITLLALHRLARIQLTSTSSCVTTGMRHIDYYISGNLTEPKQEAQQQYREELITLKGAAHCFNYYATEPEKPVVKPGRESWGITDENIVFVSGANFYKIIPELRETWAKIIAAVPNSILVLYPFNPNWSNNYQAGTHFVNDMRSIFSKYGIDKKRLIVIKTLPSRSDIKECLKLCDVYLDSYPFAGVNSLVEPLEIGLPIVTKDGNSFRSLMGSGLLRSLSIPDLITDNETAYINLAINLANNPEFRQQKRQEIQEKMQQKPAFLDSHAYGKEIGELFQELFQKWQNIHTPKTRESTGENYLTAEFINRLVGCVNLYEIDPTDQSLIEELRQLRKQIADFWLETPPKELETIYQGKIRQAYQALLASGIQNEPQTEDEQKFLKELVDISLGLTNPKAVNALLGGMLYFPPGKMLVRDAKNRLPQWLINDYKQVFESREVAQKLEEAFKSQSPHLPEESTDRGLVTKPLQADEFKPEKNVVLTKNKADNLETTQQKFLNQLFGSVNLYYIDPSDESVVKELRQVRKQMADFWINLEPKKLETFYLGEMGKGYKALLSSGIQNQTLTDSEQTSLQELATQLAKGIEAPKAINYLLGAMLYCRQGQLQVQDSSKLPQWLQLDYYKFVSK